MIQEIRHSFHFSLCSFFHLPTKKIIIPKYVCFVNRETKAKLFLAVTVTNNFNIRTSFFMKTVMFLLHMHVNYLDTISFFLILIGGCFLFCFVFIFMDIKFALIRICIQKRHIFSELLLLIL